VIRGQFQQSLEQRIRERRSKIMEDLVSGNAKTLDTYRELVGHLRGLDEALVLCDETNKDMNIQ
jgi:hypothetical protein